MVSFVITAYTNAALEQIIVQISHNNQQNVKNI